MPVQQGHVVGTVHHQLIAIGPGCPEFPSRVADDTGNIPLLVLKRGELPHIGPVELREEICDGQIADGAVRQGVHLRARPRRFIHGKGSLSGFAPVAERCLCLRPDAVLGNQGEVIDQRVGQPARQGGRIVNLLLPGEDSPQECGVFPAYKLRHRGGIGEPCRIHVREPGPDRLR